MKDLSDIEIIRNIDKSDMLSILLNFSQQCKNAVETAQKFELPENFRHAKNIVISGMGGSAIGGDLVRSIFIDELKLPVIINRNYFIPEFVNEDTLFIASSYSGNTEETISSLENAINKRANIITISSGGKIQELSEKYNLSHFLIPEKNLQPRCAFGYLFLPLVVFLSKLGFISDQSENLDDAIKIISQTANTLSPDKDNFAKQLAYLLYNRIPIIYASQNYLDVVAMRWKGQFNENSKTMAFYNVIPEMNHNEIVGWGIPLDITRRCIVIILSYNADFEKIRKRMEITKSLISGLGTQVIDISAIGNSNLARVLYLIYLGDLTSFYLAILNETDPSPVERISLLKRKLEE